MHGPIVTTFVSSRTWSRFVQLEKGVETKARDVEPRRKGPTYTFLVSDRVSAIFKFMVYGCQQANGTALLQCVFSVLPHRFLMMDDLASPYMAMVLNVRSGIHHACYGHCALRGRNQSRQNSAAPGFSLKKPNRWNKRKAILDCFAVVENFVSTWRNLEERVGWVGGMRLGLMTRSFCSCRFYRIRSVFPTDRKQRGSN